MKNKTLYILEGRSHKTGKSYPNKVEHIIGIFTCVERAKWWIKNEGKNFYPKHWKKFKNHFWAITACESLNQNDTYLHSFHQKE